jgi:hypothetical protein
VVLFAVGGALIAGLWAITHSNPRRVKTVADIGAALQALPQQPYTFTMVPGMRQLQVFNLPPGSGGHTLQRVASVPMPAGFDLVETSSNESAVISQDPSDPTPYVAIIRRSAVRKSAMATGSMPPSLSGQQAPPGHSAQVETRLCRVKRETGELETIASMPYPVHAIAISPATAYWVKQPGQPADIPPLQPMEPLPATPHGSRAGPQTLMAVAMVRPLSRSRALHPSSFMVLDRRTHAQHAIDCSLPTWVNLKLLGNEVVIEADSTLSFNDTRHWFYEPNADRVVRLPDSCDSTPVVAGAWLVWKHSQYTMTPSSARASGTSGQYVSSTLQLLASRHDGSDSRVLATFPTVRGMPDVVDLREYGDMICCVTRDWDGSDLAGYLYRLDPDHRKVERLTLLPGFQGLARFADGCLYYVAEESHIKFLGFSSSKGYGLYRYRLPGRQGQ